MEFNNLLFTVKNRIAFLTINRPTKLNALNLETLGELEAVFLHIRDNEGISVIILTGSGEKAFVAGADIVELSKCTNQTGKNFSEKGQKLFNLIEKLSKPVIAVVNGFALGGGCELALSCHIRLASENAKFGQPEVNLGIIPGYGGTQRLARLINTGRATEYILTGNIIDADEALRIGLVNKIYSSETLRENAIKLAEKIDSKGQLAVSMALNSIMSTNNISQDEGMILEADLFSKCCGTDDFKEGTAAFLEKRKPVFINK